MTGLHSFTQKKLIKILLLALPSLVSSSAEANAWVAVAGNCLGNPTIFTLPLTNCLNTQNIDGIELISGVTLTDDRLGSDALSIGNGNFVITNSTISKTHLESTPADGDGNTAQSTVLIRTQNRIQGSLTIKDSTLQSNGERPVFMLENIEQYKLTLKDTQITSRQDATAQNTASAIFYVTQTSFNTPRSLQIELDNVDIQSNAYSIFAGYWDSQPLASPAEFSVKNSRITNNGALLYNISSGMVGSLDITNSIINNQRLAESGGTIPLTRWILAIMNRTHVTIADHSELNASDSLFQINSQGASSTDRSSITISDSELNSGKGMTGKMAEGYHIGANFNGDLLIKNSSLDVYGNPGANALGILTSRGGMTEIQGSSISMHGTGYALGFGYDSIANNVATGLITAYDDGSGTLRRTTITTQGNSTASSTTGIALRIAEQGKVTLDHTDIKTEGFKATAVYMSPAVSANSSGIAIFKESNTITTLGDEAMGIYANGTQQLDITDLSITTAGQSATGIYTQNAKLSELKQLRVNTLGSNSYALNIEHTNTINNNDLTITDSSLNSQNVSTPAIYYGNKNDSTIRLQSSYLVGGKLNTDLGVAFASKSTNTGKSTLDVINSTIWGDIIPNGGTHIVKLSGATTWNGTAVKTSTDKIIDQVNIETNSQWIVKNSSHVQDLNNNGTITVFQPNTRPSGFDENDYYKLTVHGDYTSNGGTLILNQELNARELGDYFFVQGSVTGTTKLRINPTESSGAATVGKGILMVYVGDIPATGASSLISPLSSSPTPFSGGVTNASMFVLENTLNAGAYQYQLVYHPESDTSKAGWYLSSACLVADCSTPTPPIIPPIDPPVEPPVEPPELPEPPTPPVPQPQQYRPLAITASVLPSVVQYADLNSLPSYHDRDSNQREATPSYVWARVLGVNRGHNPLSGTAHQREQDFLSRGASFDVSVTGVQVGGQLYEHINDTQTEVVAGIYTGISRVTSDVTQVYQDKSAGDISLDSYTVGAYFTEKRQDSSYIDALIQWSRLRDISISTHPTPEHIDTRGQILTGSVEFGWTYPLESSWQLVPQGQLIYQHTQLDDATDNDTFVIDYKSKNTVSMRLGLEANHSITSNHTHPLLFKVKTNLWQTLGNNTNHSTVFGRDRSASTALPLRSELDSSWVDLSIGVQGRTHKGWDMDTWVRYQQGLNSRHSDGYAGHLRMSYAW